MVDNWSTKLHVAVEEAPAATQATSSLSDWEATEHHAGPHKLKFNSQASSTLDAIPFTTWCFRSKFVLSGLSQQQEHEGGVQRPFPP